MISYYPKNHVRPRRRDFPWSSFTYKGFTPPAPIKTKPASPEPNSKLLALFIILGFISAVISTFKPTS